MIRVQKEMGTSKQVSFKVGVDATIVVKSWQLFTRHGDIVGGKLPNHFFDVKESSDKEIVVFMT